MLKPGRNTNTFTSTLVGLWIGGNSVTFGSSILKPIVTSYQTFNILLLLPTAAFLAALSLVYMRFSVHRAHVNLISTLILACVVMSMTQLIYYGLNYKLLLVGVAPILIIIGFYSYGVYLTMCENALRAFTLGLVLSSSLGFIFFVNEAPLNRNWIFISILLGIFFIYLSTSVRRNLYALKLLLAGCATLSIYYGSRGVAVSAILALVIIILHGLCKKHKLLFRTMTSVVLLAAFASFPLGVTYYNTDHYKDATELSYSLTGRSLDSSRLKRWDEVWEFGIRNPVFGSGISATIAGISEGEGGKPHNLVAEIFLRGGIVAVLLYFYFYNRIQRIILYSRDSGGFIGIFLAVVSLGVFYSLGGFTHLPGTALISVLFGLMVCRSARAG